MATQQTNGPINNRDVEEWTTRFNEVLAKPGDVINSRSPEGSQPWYSSFFGCFSPVDLCLMTWCLPCVTFGKTHHRMQKSGTLEGYEPINTSVSRNRPIMGEVKPKLIPIKFSASSSVVHHASASTGYRCLCNAQRCARSTTSTVAA